MRSRRRRSCERRREFRLDASTQRREERERQKEDEGKEKRKKRKTKSFSTGTKPVLLSEVKSLSLVLKKKGRGLLA